MSSFHTDQKSKVRNSAKNYPKKSNSSSTTTVRDVVGILAGIGGFIVFYFWVAGRMFAAGYFGAMNIPSFMVSFQIWEYIEQSWSRLLFILLLYLIAGSILLLVLSSLWHWLSVFVHNFTKAITKKIEFSIPRIDLHLPNLKANIYLLRQLFRAGLFLLLFSFLLFYIFLMGINNGNLVVLNAQTVTVTTSNDNPLLFNNRELKLLAYNQGKYYVFEQIDPATCLPKVMIIRESDITYVELGPRSSIDLPTCKTEAVNFLLFQLPIRIPPKLISSLPY